MGLYYSNKFDDGSQVAVWEITESEQQLRDMCVLPNEELEELELTTNQQRRRERLAVRALLDHLFQEKVYLGYHDNGRPYLINSITEISITHTKRFACVYTHPELCVGIDMECLNRSFEAVEKRVIHPSEEEFLSDKESVRHQQLALIWSAKEALYKYLSDTDEDFFSRLYIEKFSPKDEGEIDALYYDKDGEAEEYTLQYMLFEDHVMVRIIEEE